MPIVVISTQISTPPIVSDTGEQIFLDNFTEAVSNTPLDSHTPDVGTGWTKLESVNCAGCDIRALAGGFNVARNTLDVAQARVIYTAQATYSSALYDVTAEVRDQFGVPNDDDPWWLHARVTDASNYYAAGAYLSGANPDIFIIKKEAGVVTTLASANSGFSFSASTTVKFEIRNATKKLFINGAEILSTSDNSLTSTGECGLSLGNTRLSSDDIDTGWTFDVFEIRVF